MKSDPLHPFFQKFDQFADAPNAVAKMRQFILQLAAHGKLVEQSPDDEPASALVSRIEKKFKTERSQKDLRSSPVEPLKREELPVIPLTWEWVRLGNVVEYGSSDKTDSSDIPEDAWLLDLEDIERDTSRLLQRKSFRHGPSKSTKTAFAIGDVLYGKLRPYLNKVIVADAPGYCTTEIIPIRAFGIIEPAYLCYVLKRPGHITYANSKSYGMNLPRLGTEEARRAPLPLPPLAEQKRIVAKVDELMALCDRLEAQQQERETRHAALARASLARFAEAPIPANLNFLFHPSYTIPPADLRKFILTLAVQGKLVPQDPNEESAKGTFPKLASAALAFNDDGFPAHWLRVPLGKTGEWRGGGTSSKSRLDFWAGNIPWVSPKDMKVLHIGDAQDHISESAVEGSSVRMIPAGSLLMVVRGMILARAFPVAVTTRAVTINQDMKALLPFEAKTKDYLLVALRAFEPDVLAAIDRSTHGTCKLETEFLQDFTIPIPPLAEQRRIVAKVDQLMGLVDQLEAHLVASRTTAANLLEALVAELTTSATRPSANGALHISPGQRPGTGVWTFSKRGGEMSSDSHFVAERRCVRSTNRSASIPRTTSCHADALRLVWRTQPRSCSKRALLRNKSGLAVHSGATFPSVRKRRQAGRTPNASRARMRGRIREAFGVRRACSRFCTAKAGDNRANGSARATCDPFEGSSLICPNSSPGALPQAGIKRAFGPKPKSPCPNPSPSSSSTSSSARRNAAHSSTPTRVPSSMTQKTTTAHGRFRRSFGCS